jgi:hypothetical protein
VTWLEQVLSQNQQAKFKTVFGHMPLYPFAFMRANGYRGLGHPQFSLNLEGVLEYYNKDSF